MYDFQLNVKKKNKNNIIYLFYYSHRVKFDKKKKMSYRLNMSLHTRALVDDFLYVRQRCPWLLLSTR